MRPPTWDESAEPTGEQWLDWLLEHDREDRILLVDTLLTRATLAYRCICEDHAHRIETLESYNAELAHALTEVELPADDEQVVVLGVVVDEDGCG